MINKQNAMEIICYLPSHGKYCFACLLCMSIMGCSTPPEAQSSTESPPQLTEGQNFWNELIKQDEYLRSQFKKIHTGMSETQVRDLMGKEPRILRENLWGFELSRASDTAAEIHNILLVAFEDGIVVSTDVTYTCIETRLKE